MTPLHAFWLSLVVVALCGVWTPTAVSHQWMGRLRPALARFEITPKALAHVMDLRVKQVYAQLALEAPMQAPRLEEVWAVYPLALDAYCVDYLEARGYRCFHRDRLADALTRLLDHKKPMAAMALEPERMKGRA